jgi:hypothetical protein
MFPVRLTENRYVNPDAIADIEYTPKGSRSDDAFFTVLFLNNQTPLVHLKGDEADEALENWKAAHEEKRRQTESSIARSVRGKAK